MFDTSIASIKEAKEFYKLMGCSHFHMAREYPPRYEEYKILRITEQMEKEWKLEQVDEYYNRIVKSEDEKIWHIHSTMAELVESLKNDNALMRILDATRFIRDKVPYKDMVIVSETINGRKNRKFRSGLIYLAFDMKNITVAKEFVELSLHFATYIEQKTRELARCQNATNLCLAISDELKI